MNGYLIAGSSLATWLGLCAVVFRAPDFIATVSHFVRPGGRHAR